MGDCPLLGDAGKGGELSTLEYDDDISKNLSSAVLSCNGSKLHWLFQPDCGEDQTMMASFLSKKFLVLLGCFSKD